MPINSGVDRQNGTFTQCNWIAAKTSSSIVTRINVDASHLEKKNQAPKPVFGVILKQVPLDALC